MTRISRNADLGRRRLVREEWAGVLPRLGPSAERYVAAWLQGSTTVEVARRFRNPTSGKPVSTTVVSAAVRRAVAVAREEAAAREARR
jgi:hypothetical protein